MNLSAKKKKIGLIFFACLLIAWSIFLLFVDLETMAETIGLQNAYLILFFVAATAGTSFLTSAGFYAIYGSYAAVGFDPVVIAIIGGLGMTIGDSIYFLFSGKVGDVVNENMWYEKVYIFFIKLPRWGVYLFTYLYASFAPIPNDILMLTLGVMKYNFRYILPIIILGNVTLLLLVAYGVHITFF